MAGGRGPCEREAPRGGVCVWVLIVYQMITNGKAGATGTRVAVFGTVVGGWDGLDYGASVGPRRCSPCFGPGVQFLPGCVPFSAKCVHFSGQITPNVSTFSRQTPQMCPPSTRMCQPGLDKGKGRGERGE